MVREACQASGTRLIVASGYNQEISHDVYNFLEYIISIQKRKLGTMQHLRRQHKFYWVSRGNKYKYNNTL